VIGDTASVGVVGVRASDRVSSPDLQRDLGRPAEHHQHGNQIHAQSGVANSSRLSTLYHGGWPIEKCLYMLLLYGMYDFVKFDVMNAKVHKIKVH